MQDVMVDLETLGNSAGCIILSIGAVAFDPAKGQIGNQSFYCVINTASCAEAGLKTDKDTVNFWSQQAPEARTVIAEADTSTIRLRAALGGFNEYLRQFGDQVRLWGNGSDFDNAILGYAYKALWIDPAWKFRNNRCFRTLKNLRPEIGFKRVGTYHNALDDARTQAEHALAIFADLAGKAPAMADNDDLLG